MNPEVQMTLDEAVSEVTDILLGIDVHWVPELDHYQSVTRAINRALRSVATEQEWSYYASDEVVATAVAGMQEVRFRSTIRPRITGDDAVRLVHPDSGAVIAWAYYQPRDALHKYRHMHGLWASHTRRDLAFSRPLLMSEEGAKIVVPVMREPNQFRLPLRPTNPEAPIPEVPVEVREQYIDFDYPDLVLRKAAYMYASTKPMLQPRVQTLDADFKTLMYALVERDTRNTETPFQNEWTLGIEGDVLGTSRSSYTPHTDSGYEF